MRPIWIALLLLLQEPTREALDWFRQGEQAEAFSPRQAELFAQAVAADPKFAEARYNLSLVYLRLERFAEAREHLEAFTQLRPQDPKGFLLKSQACVRLDLPDEAIRDLQSALSLQPGDGEAWDALSRLLLDSGRFQEALAAAKQALETGSAPGDVHFQIGLAQFRLGYKEEAAQSLQAFLQQDPEDYQANYLLGIILLESDEREKALSHLLRAEAADDSDAELTRTIGDLLAEMGQDREAARRLASLESRTSLNSANLGAIAVREKRWKDAEGFLRKALADEPFDALTWGYLGDALAGQGKAQEAIAAYDQAIKYDPGDIKSHLNAASLSADNGLTEQALGYLNRAVVLAPQDGFVQFSLGLVKERLGANADEAQAHYLKALEFGEKRPFLHFRLTFLFAKQSQRDQALEHLKLALDQDRQRFHPLLVQELKKVRSDLDSIRYTPRFAELMREYEPKQP